MGIDASGFGRPRCGHREDTDTKGFQMSVIVKPDQIRAGLLHAENAAAEFRGARARTADAAGQHMRDLASCLTDAAEDLRGVLDVVLGVVDAHRDNVEDCITDFVNSDGNSAGEFHGLSR